MRTWDEYYKVLKLRKQKFSYKEIERITGISKNTISSWVKGKSHPRGMSYAQEKQFKEYVKNSISIAEVCRNLNIKTSGGNYKRIKWEINRLNLDISHFKGQSYLKGQSHQRTPKRPLKKILKKNTKYASSRLKERLLKEGYFEHKCHVCQKAKWKNYQIPLELEHINGDKFDNRINNLTLLCPNCHALTPTYCGKNSTKYKKHTQLEKNPNKCIDCNKQIYKTSKRCKKCSEKKKNINRINQRPRKEQLAHDIENMSWLAVGRKYGVSDNAVRKWAKNYNLI